jgi:hypothetical protein
MSEYKAWSTLLAAGLTVRDKEQKVSELAVKQLLREMVEAHEIVGRRASHLSAIEALKIILAEMQRLIDFLESGQPLRDPDFLNTQVRKIFEDLEKILRPKPADFVPPRS